jgi:hypothetical protein
MNEHWQLLGGWIYCRCWQTYRDFLKAGCRVVMVGCQTGHHACCKEKWRLPEVKNG